MGFNSVGKGTTRVFLGLGRKDDLLFGGRKGRELDRWRKGKGLALGEWNEGVLARI